MRPCPECNAALQQGYKDGLMTWECPAAHGVGINLVDAYQHLQIDELEAIWQGAHAAPKSKLLSPLSGKAMVEVTFLVDDDTSFGNQGPDARDMTIEVDVENHFGWFSLEELGSMPGEGAERGPAAPGLVGLDQMDAADDRSDAMFDSLTANDYLDLE